MKSAIKIQSLRLLATTGYCEDSFVRRQVDKRNVVYRMYGREAMMSFLE